MQIVTFLYIFLFSLIEETLICGNFVSECVQATINLWSGQMGQSNPFFKEALTQNLKKIKLYSKI
jgi:hypothetical protein